MPFYCYSPIDDDAPLGSRTTVERFFSMGEAPREIVVDGRTYARDYQAEGTNTRPPGNWPLYSDSLGVHPDQRREAMEHAAKNGVPTDFTSDGQAVFESPSHRKKYCEVYGYHDRNAGYSDPTPRA